MAGGVRSIQKILSQPKSDNKKSNSEEENLYFRKVKMIAAKKITIKTFVQEFEKLKEEVEELRPLKHKLIDLEEKLEKAMLDTAIDVDDKEVSSGIQLTCKKCERSL